MSDKPQEGDYRPSEDVLDPELFFGFVSPIGVGGGTLEWLLKEALEEVGYNLKVVRVISELASLKSSVEGSPLPFPDISAPCTEQNRYKRSIDAGDKFCELMASASDSVAEDGNGRGQDSLVALAIRRVLQHRKEYWAARQARGKGAPPVPGDWPFIPLPRQAYLFRSLKRQGEVARLRRVYGRAFILISAYSPREVRVDRLSRKLASSDLKFSPDYARHKAEELIKIDEYEQGISYGQDVRHAYAMADFFVDASANPADITSELRRFIAMLFNYQFHTPTPDEQGMALADLASLRSAHLSRQVGAAITRSDGTIVAIGCNDVPKAGGGVYWPGEGDGRDFNLRKNTSLEVRDEVFREVLTGTMTRLIEAGSLSPEAKAAFKKDPEEFIEANFRVALRDTRLMDILEFDRSVHAEMMAISDAARKGVSLEGCTLYATTFPCHNCARHIVSSGIRRAVYIHPYEKSLTKRLHGDAIGVDLSLHTGKDLVRFDPFVGTAPNLYGPLFTMGKRRGEGVRWKRIAHWEKLVSQPRLKGEPVLYTRNERIAVDWIIGEMRKRNLIVTDGGTGDVKETDDTGRAGSGSGAHGRGEAATQ
jgi:deoxycytidylate deaminase